MYSNFLGGARKKITLYYVQNGAFTKPSLLQESRLTGGGSPNLVDLVERKVPVEWKVPVERKMGAAHRFH